MKNLEIRLARELLGLSQKEAAEHLGGVNQRSWAYWESGERTVPQDVIEKIEQLLKRRKEILDFVYKKGEQVQQMAVIFYNMPEEIGGSVLELKFNNSLATMLHLDFGAKIVKFDAPKYVEWLTSQDDIRDTPQRRSEWAAIQALQKKGLTSPD